jgi:hypothetical protein
MPTDVPILSARIIAASILLYLLGLLFFTLSHKIVPENDLTKLSGIIESVEIKESARGTTKFDILIKSNNTKSHLTQNWFYMNDAQNLHLIRPGMRINAFVEKDDLFDRNIYRYWRIDANEKTILSITKSKQKAAEENKIMRNLSGYVVATATLILLIGFAFASKRR